MSVILLILAGAGVALSFYGLGWLDGRHDLRKEYAAVGRTVQRHEKHEVKKSAN